MNNQRLNDQLQINPDKSVMTKKKILRALFAQPILLIPIALDSWPRAMKTALAAIFFSVAVLTATKTATALNQAKEWATWFESRVEKVTIDNDQLTWRFPENMPAIFWKNSYRIDFMPAQSEFTEINQFREGKRGIWISPHKIYWWFQNQNNEIIRQPIWRDGRIFGHIDPASLIGEQTVIEPGEFVPQARRLTWRLIVPLITLAETARTLFLFFFYTLIFTVVPFVVRSTMSNYGFTAVHAFYLYTGIPPLVIATIYSLFPLPWLDFNSLFVIGFLVYLGFVAWRSGRVFDSTDKQTGKNKNN